MSSLQIIKETILGRLNYLRLIEDEDRLSWIGWGGVDEFWNWEDELVEPLAEKLHGIYQDIFNKSIGNSFFHRFTDAVERTLREEMPTINLMCVRGREIDETVDAIVEMIERRMDE
jgi:hypothetical protein